MPIDEYVAAGPEQEQTGQSLELHFLHSRLIHARRVAQVARSLATMFSTMTVLSTGGAPQLPQAQIPPLLSELVVTKAMHHLASTIGSRAWATTGQGVWHSVLSSSTIGDMPQYWVVDQSVTATGAGQLLAPWEGLPGWFDDETSKPVLEPFTQHDRRLATQATSLDLVHSEVLPQFEDD